MSSAGTDVSRAGRFLQTDSHRRIIRSISAIDVHLRRIGDLWADKLGVTSLEWVILAAVMDLDRGDGARVSDVAVLTRFDRSAILRQAKRLAIAGMLRPFEASSSQYLFLSQAMREKLGNFEISRACAQAEIFGDIDHEGISNLKKHLVSMEERAMDVIRRLARG